MIIYKYLDLEGAIKTIKGNCVLLRSPVEYNDPFDCIFYTNNKDYNKAFRLFINYELFKESKKQLLVKNKKCVGGIITKRDVIEIDKKTRENLVYVADDKLDKCFTMACKILNTTVQKSKAKFKRTFKKIYNEMREVSLVSCFGTTHDNILMWSHYGDKHRGACIEFETEDNKDFKPVHYSGEMISFDLTRLFEYYFGHEYNNKQIDPTDEKYLFLSGSLLTKAEEWNYENEVRCVFSKNKPDERIIDGFIEDKITKEQIPAKFLKMPLIRKIYVGCEASRDDLTAIKKCAGDIPVSQLKKVDGKYKLIEKK